MEYHISFIKLALIGLLLTVGVKAKDIEFSIFELTNIAQKIYNNECAGKLKYLVYWNDAENFASVGIGHFIWYPKGIKKEFDESFPKLLTYMKHQGLVLPEWLAEAKYNPWNSKKEMLKDLGKVAKEASYWGMPLLAMMYTRGPKIENEYDPKVVKHAARVGAELGADIVKVPYTGSPESFARAVEGCFVPVVVAGGPKVSSDREFLSMVKGAMEAGAMGVSVGRNVFQRKDASSMLKALNLIVHGGASVDEALEALKSHLRSAASMGLAIAALMQLSPKYSS